MRVYMFHSCQFHAPMMSPFFRSHEPFEDIIMDDVCPPFHALRQPTDGKSDFDTRLTPTVSIESDSSESSYPTYSVGSYRSKPSQPSMIWLSLDSSTSSAGPVPPLVCGHVFICTRAVPRRRGHAWGGGRGGDATGGFGNRYLPLDVLLGWRVLSWSQG